jgi:restriction system protein
MPKWIDESKAQNICLVEGKVMAIPKFDELFNPLLEAMKKLGGSATVSELNEEVTKSLNLTDEEVAVQRNDRMTVLQYRLTWTRSYLKAYGLLDNSERGVWVLTPKGNDIDVVDPRQIVRFVQEQSRVKKGKLAVKNSESPIGPEIVEVAEAVLEENWREELLSRLLDLAPDAFERLCQRLLRESGFVEVRVTGRSGDGGIDGVGIVRLGGLLGFPILFQCKRYRGGVGASTIRDFRGAMIGRADRGLVITTGTFSRDAKIEATRDGAPPIDLIDGEQLLDKLKELRLGITVKMVEQISVLPDFFKEI